MSAGEQKAKHVPYREYTLVGQHSAGGLIREVLKLIAEGFEPLGGVAIDSSDGGNFWQALVRR